MIDPKELNIGNYVCYCKANNYNTMVEAVENTGITFISDEYGIKCRRDIKDPLSEKAPIDFFNTEILYPIEITEEFLEKNGFYTTFNGRDEIKSYHLQLKEHEKVKYIISYYENGFLHVEQTPYDIYKNLGVKYVHQLQNIFRMCDINKNLIL